jgi:voltage-gated potassium channel
MESRQKLKLTAWTLLIILAAGTIGYHLLEGWSFLDSLYMTVITLTTVGYSEVHPLTHPETKLFTILLILCGMGVVFYVLGLFTKSLIEGQIRDVLGRRRVKRSIEALEGHTIVCGYGRIGESICRELSLSGVSFVVVEKEPAMLEKVENEGYLMVLGDATSEEALMAAGIDRAHALIPAASTDADNVYITLTARGLNPKLFIVARAAEAAAAKKLTWAGADRVVSPYVMSGRRMANLLLRPTVVEFIESSLYDPAMELVMEEIHLPDETVLEGKTLQSSGLRKEYGIIVVAIKHKEGTLLVNPTPDESLCAGDTLIALGRRQDFRRIAGNMGGDVTHNCEGPIGKN